MKTLIISVTGKGFRYANLIKNYIQQKNIRCYIVRATELQDFIQNRKLSSSDTIIYARAAGRILNRNYVNLEKHGYLIVNSARTLELTNNKLLSNQFAEKNNIPVAKTFRYDKTIDTPQKIDILLKKYKCLVLKPTRSQGQGIYCQKLIYGDNRDVSKIVKSIPGRIVQIQEYISYKKLIRLIVIDYKVVDGTATYDVPTKNWKCSVCLNPNIKKLPYLEPGLRKLAQLTAKTFGAQINFIDFFEDSSGRYILNEINTACSLIIHERVTGIEIHKHIADFIAGLF